jgi:hypothetical protein
MLIIDNNVLIEQIDDSIKDEIISNQRMVPPGKSLMALNGALINIEDLDLYLYVSLYFLDNDVSDYLLCQTNLLLVLCPKWTLIISIL